MNNSKLKICKQTRKIASDTLLVTLKKLLSSSKPISEVLFRDTWLLELRKHKQIFPDGWYMPPPHGMGVLFGNYNRTGRTNYRNLREKEYLPRNNIFLNNENELAYVYASPVDKKTGTIGDFGMTFYFGKNKFVQTHLKQCLDIDKEIFQKINVGMHFSEIYNVAEKIFNKYRLSNEIISKTDSAVFNIGHTVPNFDELSIEEKKFIEKVNWKEIKNAISKKRKFVNSKEQEKFQGKTVITIEPRLTSLKNPNIPMSSYHVIIAAKENGEKKLLTDFEKIFKYIGMDYMF